MHMRKILLSGFVIFTFVGYALQQRYGDEASVTVTPIVATPPPSTPTPIPQNMMGGGMGQGMMSGYKDGSYTGSVADAFYGNIQVKAIISGGKITDVQFLQYPSDRRQSIEINSQAMPYLTQEAIQAQSANVNGVSGASQTSAAFIQSLQSALDQAKI